MLVQSDKKFPYWNHVLIIPEAFNLRAAEPLIRLCRRADWNKKHVVDSLSSKLYIKGNNSKILAVECMPFLLRFKYSLSLSLSLSACVFVHSDGLYVHFSRF